MAKEAGISEHSVLRIWRAFGLKPHRVDSFKLSADPMFVEFLAFLGRIDAAFSDDGKSQLHLIISDSSHR